GFVQLFAGGAVGGVARNASRERVAVGGALVHSIAVVGAAARRLVVGL
nr:hypothetical protein [Tanacetum cinerariifolium]